jgi:hypothetical protein
MVTSIVIFFEVRQNEQHPGRLRASAVIAFNPAGVIAGGKLASPKNIFKNIFAAVQFGLI